MSGAARIVSLAGRNLRIDATSPRAWNAVSPAIAHLPAASFAEHAEIRWTIAEEEDGWNPPTPDGWGNYRMPGGGLAVVQAAPACAEIYHAGSEIELRATAAALAS